MSDMFARGDRSHACGPTLILPLWSRDVKMGAAGHDGCHTVVTRSPDCRDHRELLSLNTVACLHHFVPLIPQQ